MDESTQSSQIRRFKVEEDIEIKYEKMEPEERICRLCYKMCGNFTTIDGDFKEVMDVLLLVIDMAAIKEPVICTLCSEILFKYFDFKARCFNAYNYLVEFVNGKDKLNLKDIYPNKYRHSDCVPEDQDICGLCMTLIKKCLAIFPDVVAKTLKQCLPELDLNIIKEPAICADCHAALDKYSLFKMTIFIAEEKLTYMETVDISSKSEMELSTFLQIIIREKISEMNGNVGDIIQLKKMLCNDKEIAEEEVELKYDASRDINGLISNNEQAFIPKNMLDSEIDRNEIMFHLKETFCGEEGIEFKQELVVGVEDQKVFHVEEVDIKADKLDSDRFEGSAMTQPKVVATLNEKRECSLPNFENSSEAVMMFKCYSCTYETKRKVLLNRHMLKHKNVSEAKIYKCDSCLYQTKKRYCFKRHLMNCKDPLEVMIHKCDSCSYQTRHKTCLSTHLLKHKDVSEVTMYKCDSCLYETKFKNNFNAHVQIHKKPSEVTMYKCDSCLFQSKYKQKLKIHVMKHKDPSEVTMYVCDSCSYQTLYRNLIKIHLLRHKDPSEVPWYKCDSCPYRSIRKSHLKEHLLIHKDPSEVKMYKCDSCAYQSIRKSHFKEHLLKHKKISEVTLYECDSCEFKTKYIRGLKIHLLTHKDPSEVKMYKCDSCVYQTKNKNYLNRHVLKHKEFCEATAYKCRLCTFQTKRKYYLKTHLLRHKNSSDVKVNLEHSYELSTCG